jgi:hypothetical protein
VLGLEPGDKVALDQFFARAASPQRGEADGRKTIYRKIFTPQKFPGRYIPSTGMGSI